MTRDLEIKGKIDPSGAEKGAKAFNKAQDSIAKKAEEAARKAVQASGVAARATKDRESAEKRLERQIEAAERKADMHGKRGLDRVRAQKLAQLELARAHGATAEQVDRLSRAYDTMARRAEVAQQRSAAAAQRRQAETRMSGWLLEAGRVFRAGGLLAAGAGASLGTAEVVGNFLETTKRTAELTAAMRVLGEVSGSTQASMRGAVQEIKALQFSNLDALAVVNRLAAVGVPALVDRAAELASVAREVSVIMGTTVSESLDRLVAAIVKEELQILDTTGLQIKWIDGYKQLAKERGVGIMQLSEEEKILSRLNQVIDQGATRQGVFAEGLKTSGGQARLLQLELKKIGEELARIVDTPIEGFFRWLAEAAGSVNRSIAELGGALELSAIEQRLLRERVGVTHERRQEGPFGLFSVVRPLPQERGGPRLVGAARREAVLADLRAFPGSFLSTTTGGIPMSDVVGDLFSQRAGLAAGGMTTQARQAGGSLQNLLVKRLFPPEPDEKLKPAGAVKPEQFGLFGFESEMAQFRRQSREVLDSLADGLQGVALAARQTGLSGIGGGALTGVPALDIGAVDRLLGGQESGMVSVTDMATARLRSMEEQDREARRLIEDRRRFIEDQNFQLFWSLKRQSQDLFSAMIAGGDRFWNFFKKAGLTVVSEVFSSMTANLLMPLFGGVAQDPTRVSALGGLIPGVAMGRRVRRRAGADILDDGLGAIGMPGAPGGTSGFAGPVGSMSGGAATMAGAAGLGGKLGGLSAASLAPLAGFGAAFGVSRIPTRGRLAGGIKGGVVGGIGAWSALKFSPALLKLLGVPGANIFIGAAVGIGALIGSLGGRARRRAKRKVQDVYGVSIQDEGLVAQVVEIAKGFGGNLDLAVSSPAVRELVQLYAMATGQGPGSTAPKLQTGILLTQRGGMLFQSAQFANGSPTLVQSSLPTIGVNPRAPVNVVQLDPAETRAIIAQAAAAGAAGSPSVVQDAAYRAMAASHKRRETSILLFEPMTAASS